MTRWRQLLTRPGEKGFGEECIAMGWKAGITQRLSDTSLAEWIPLAKRPGPLPGQAPVSADGSALTYFPVWYVTLQP